MTLVAAALAVSAYKVGSVIWYAGSVSVSGETVPAEGWLVCNGALVDKTKYAYLFAEVGFAFSPTPGTDPGSNQFYLPDQTDARDMVSLGATNFTVRGTKGGAKTVALDAAGAHEPSHTHIQGNNDGFVGNSGSTTASTGPEVTGPYIGPVVSYLTPYWGPGTGGGGNSGLGGAVTTAMGQPNGRSAGSPTAHQNMHPLKVVGGCLIRFLPH